jgi:hypothetical protein
MLYRRWKLSMGKAVFQGSADSKPLDRSTPNFVKNDYRPNIMQQTNFHNIRPKGFVCPIWLCCTFSVCQFFFHFLSRPSSGRPERAGRLAKLVPQTTSFATRKCLLGVSSMKKNFHGGVPLHPNFQRAFCMQIEKVE